MQKSWLGSPSGHLLLIHQGLLHFLPSCHLYSSLSYIHLYHFLSSSFITQSSAIKPSKFPIPLTPLSANTFNQHERRSIYQRAQRDSNQHEQRNVDRRTINRGQPNAIDRECRVRDVRCIPDHPDESIQPGDHSSRYLPITCRNSLGSYHRPPTTVDDSLRL